MVFSLYSKIPKRRYSVCTRPLIILSPFKLKQLKLFIFFYAEKDYFPMNCCGFCPNLLAYPN